MSGVVHEHSNVIAHSFNNVIIDNEQNIYHHQLSHACVELITTSYSIENSASTLPNNVNTPKALNTSGVSTAFSSMTATASTRISDDTTNVTASTTKINSSSTSFFSLASENQIDVSTLIATNETTTNAPTLNPPRVCAEVLNLMI